MNGTILVTGATGFIGRYLVEHLLEISETVRVFVRRPDALGASIGPRVEIARGDLQDQSALRAAVRGSDTVLHLAACARAWARDASVFTDANVQAVEWLLSAAADSSVRRLVHVSTALTCPFSGPDGTAIGRSLTPYERTKLEGERRVEAYAAEGHHAVIVHPTRVYGPGPLNDANGVTRVVDLYLRGRFRVRIADGDVRANYVHASDVARGIVAAADHGRAGRHYVLGGPSNVSMREFLELVARISARLA
jgi:farnesol dehydrogenase